MDLTAGADDYRAIFDAVGEGLVVANLKGYVVEVNPAYCQMYGYSRDELIGMHTTRLIHPDHIRHIGEAFEAVAEGRSYKTTGISLRKDGSTFPFEGRGTTFRYRSLPHLLGIVRDITEQVDAQRRVREAQDRLEQRVEERTRELRLLLEVSQTVVSTLDLKTLLTLVLDQLETVVDYAGASVLLREGEDIVRMGYRMAPGATAPPVSRLSLQHFGEMWDTLGRGEPLVIGDVRGETAEAVVYRRVKGPVLDSVLGRVRSYVAVPLALKDRLIGFLELESESLNAYDERHVALVQAIGQQAAIAIENAQLYERAQQAAVLEERQRLSRELHDSVSQALYSIALGARTARALVDRDPRRVGEPVEFVLGQAERALTEMRALIFELRPETLESEGLLEALRRQADILRSRHHLSVDMVLCDEPDVPLGVKEALYRVAQEALHNALKHAEASRIKVVLTCEGGRLVLEIRDDGRGFDSTRTFPGHLGLHSMRERMDRLGGLLQIQTGEGKGTVVRTCLPYATTDSM